MDNCEGRYKGGGTTIKSQFKSEKDLEHLECEMFLFTEVEI